jgi:hypothetical protein
MDEKSDIANYYGHDHMTTNEAIAMARQSLRKLGYTPEQTHSSGPPTEWEGPWNLKAGGHVPYCRAEWEWPPRDIAPPGCFNDVEVAINMDRRTLAGVFLLFSRTNTFLPTKLLKIDVAPEVGREYRERTGSSGGMFFRSNAPARLPGAARPPRTGVPGATNVPPQSEGRGQ